LKQIKQLSELAFNRNPAYFRDYELTQKTQVDYFYKCSEQQTPPFSIPLLSNLRSFATPPPSKQIFCLYMRTYSQLTAW
jgi:hypothetical protein